MTKINTKQSSNLKISNLNKLYLFVLNHLYKNRDPVASDYPSIFKGYIISLSILLNKNS